MEDNAIFSGGPVFQRVQVGAARDVNVMLDAHARHAKPRTGMPFGPSIISPAKSSTLRENRLGLKPRSLAASVWSNAMSRFVRSAMPAVTL
jgi:hypothetical protein